MSEKLRCIEGGQSIKPQKAMDDLVDNAALGRTAYMLFSRDTLISLQFCKPGAEPDLPDNPDIFVTRLTPAEAIEFAAEMFLQMAQEPRPILYPVSDIPQAS